jgi:hypothetical protein
MGIARIEVVGLLLSALTLGSCVDVPAPDQQPQLSPAPAACEQQARSLGFIILGVDGVLEPQPDGIPAYPILALWGRTGAVHLRCRILPGGTVTIG